MSLCINPRCLNAQNLDHLLFCQACGSELLVGGQYRVIRLLGSGGFGRTFEVNHNNTLKVLKVLILDDSKAISLFKQEAEVLSKLNHPGIPKAYGYFTFIPKNGQYPLHCLVMEKIEGLDLQQYMEQRGNRPIDEKLAILWLTQLSNILHEVHEQNFFHRDIKPSNIMLKTDGNLALIDFGTAREVTQTYHQKAAGHNVTGIISAGYTPPEQANGKAVTQSDFFALGRTLVYLLTGKSPHEFSEDPRTGKLIWRDNASHVSKHITGLIDYLMEPFPGKRPQNSQMILRCISDINSNINLYSASVSGSQLPPTEIEPTKINKQPQTSAFTQVKSSKTETSKSYNKIAQFIGTAIAVTILFLIKFGTLQIHKLFRSQPSQPVVASTPGNLGTNNSELINPNYSSQIPSISEDNTSETIPYAWRKFEGGGAELWLPPSYDGGDSSRNIDDILNKLKAVNPEWKQIVQQFRQNSTGFSIWAIDTNTSDTVLVAKKEVSSSSSLESYMRKISKASSSQFHILDMKIGSSEGYEGSIQFWQKNSNSKQTI
ncbi:serine/threonine protein kinase [Calothrix membranacea FACHB-236]|nr:serine/threonine protein kinase [Calothrix membranacea FACHB-236]